MTDFYTINTIVSSIPYNGLTIKKVFTESQTEVLLIALEKDHLFPEHDSPRKTMLQMLEGEIIFQINNHKFALKNHECFQFPAKEKHNVVAIQHSKFLIIR